METYEKVALTVIWLLVALQVVLLVYSGLYIINIILTLLSGVSAAYVTKKLWVE